MDIVQELVKQIDDFDAAHVCMTGSDDDGEPTLFVLVSKDAKTIKDIKRMMDEYDDNA